MGRLEREWERVWVGEGGMRVAKPSAWAALVARDGGASGLRTFGRLTPLTPQFVPPGELKKGCDESGACASHPLLIESAIIDNTYATYIALSPTRAGD